MKKIIDSEKDVEARLFNKVKKHGGWCIKLLCLHIKGLPDRLILMPGGKLYFVELKTTGEKPRISQVVIHNKLKDMGFDVRVIDTKVGVDEFVNEISEHHE